MSKIANKVTIEMQITQVMQWLVEGMVRREILENTERLWGIKSTKTDDLIRKAREQFVKDYENINREQLVAEAIERYDFLYRAGISQRQLAVSIAAIQAKMKMLGSDTVRKP